MRFLLLCVSEYARIQCVVVMSLYCFQLSNHFTSHEKMMNKLRHLIDVEISFHLLTPVINVRHNMLSIGYFH